MKWYVTFFAFVHQKRISCHFFLPHFQLDVKRLAPHSRLIKFCHLATPPHHTSTSRLTFVWEFNLCNQPATKCDLAFIPTRPTTIPDMTVLTLQSWNYKPIHEMLLPVSILGDFSVSMHVWLCIATPNLGCYALATERLVQSSLSLSHAWSLLSLSCPMHAAVCCFCCGGKLGKCYHTVSGVLTLCKLFFLVCFTCVWHEFAMCQLLEIVEGWWWDDGGDRERDRLVGVVGCFVLLCWCPDLSLSHCLPFLRD